MAEKMPDESLLEDRFVKGRERSDLGWNTRYSCEHTVWTAIPLPVGYKAKCAVCLDIFLEQYRANKLRSVVARGAAG